MTRLLHRVDSIWTNPRGIDLGIRFLYFVGVSDAAGNSYRYVGKARNASRLSEYRNNMLKIQDGRERGATQNYRAVHFAMYQALTSGWHLDAYPLENCSDDQVNTLERQRIR